MQKLHSVKSDQLTLWFTTVKFPAMPSTRAARAAVKQRIGTKMISENSNTVPSHDDMSAIAANVIEWSRKQAEAFDQRPLSYIECMLEQMEKAEYVMLDDVADELAALLPWLRLEVCETLIGVVLDRRVVSDGTESKKLLEKLGLNLGLSAQ